MEAQLAVVEPATELPDPHTMSSHELLVELVTNMRELRAVLDPMLADPAQMLANMGPMASMFGQMLGMGRR